MRKIIVAIAISVSVIGRPCFSQLASSNTWGGFWKNQNAAYDLVPQESETIENSAPRQRVDIEKPPLSAKRSKAEEAECKRQKRELEGKRICAGSLAEFIARQGVPELGCIYREGKDAYRKFLKVISLGANGCLYNASESLGIFPSTSEPIYVYKAGNTEKDSIALREYSEMPAYWPMIVTATCGDVNFPLPDGEYLYAGIYTYTAIRGNIKKIYSFRKIDSDCQ